MCALFPSVFQAPDLITAFDEHRVSPNFKFGVLYQREGQVNNWNAGRRLEALNSSTSLLYITAHIFSLSFTVDRGGHTL